MKKGVSVADFIDQIDHPLKDEIREVRSIIISSHPDIDETIRWGGPSFEHKEPIVSVNPRVKDYVALIFHNPGKLVDQFDVLEPGPKGRAYVKLRSMQDVKNIEDHLSEIMRRLVTEVQ